MMNCRAVSRKSKEGNKVAKENSMAKITSCTAWVQNAQKAKGRQERQSGGGEDEIEPLTRLPDAGQATDPGADDEETWSSHRRRSKKLEELKKSFIEG
jgi:hypothetical protein